MIVWIFIDCSIEELISNHGLESWAWFTAYYALDYLAQVYIFTSHTCKWCAFTLLEERTKALFGKAPRAAPEPAPAGALPKGWKWSSSTDGVAGLPLSTAILWGRSHKFVAPHGSSGFSI